MIRVTADQGRLPLPLIVTLALLSGCAATPPAEEVALARETAPLSQPAEPVEAQRETLLRPDYPERYVVKAGDTLWDIASRFLRDPWRWPEVWQNNPQIPNPHLIYPGDVLRLIYIDGKPVIQVQRPDRPTVKLSPRVRVEELERPIPTIPLDAIQQFLSRARVAGEREFEEAPYIVSSADQHLITGAGHRVYVRGMDNPRTVDYVVVRKGRAYRNPDNRDEILGYEATYVADGRLVDYGEISTLRLTGSQRESLNGDRIFPADYDRIPRHFLPHAPKEPLAGRIISVVDGVSQIGQFQVVVLNLGRQDGAEPGHVLAAYQEGERISDRIGGGRVKLPNERAGVLMIFRVFDRVSYALVMNATRPMHVLDAVGNP